MQNLDRQSKVIAVLGPTNTGKTFFAMERLLSHRCGIIGFPLRLLARENYDKAVLLKGRQHVALITGEEKIIPDQAKYYFCTVESMPVSDKNIDFIAIDEVQLCADPERGHVFTDRLLRMRGRYETLFLGSAEIKKVLKELISNIKFITRPRFSRLTYSGKQKITRLKPRSAVVGFSSEQVYSVAELIRRQRGGAAIVMGALSPRTRNAQIEMFQNGDVDYLVATDAIGMGLNMDVDHIGFASLSKFDGISRRDLEPRELAQIAGRSGRYTRDGTFGVTYSAKGLDPLIVTQIETHSFKSIRWFQWRNSMLDYSSPNNLRKSLTMDPPNFFLKKIRRPNDEKLLFELLEEKPIAERLGTASAIKLLWEVCQIPDFRKQTMSDHAKLLSKIFCQLVESGNIDNSWLASEVRRIENFNGGVEVLVDRIASIRIWTYISNKSDWLCDALGWQEKTRKIEDQLSDALHEQLIQRFVDQRTTVLLNKLKDKKISGADVKPDGNVTIGGYFIGRIDGLKFVSETKLNGLANRHILAGANKALIPEFRLRACALINATDSEFNLDSQGKIQWIYKGCHQIVAKLLPGKNHLTPEVRLINIDFLDDLLKEKIKIRIQNWLDGYIRQVLSKLFSAQEANVTGLMRGIIFQLIENNGALPKPKVAKLLKRLGSADFGRIRKLGIKIGRLEIFFPFLLKPKQARLSAILWAIRRRITPIPNLPSAGTVSFTCTSDMPIKFLAVAGFRRVGNLMVRIDILERIKGMLHSQASRGPFSLGKDICHTLGCSVDQAGEVAISLGFSKTKRTMLDGKKTEIVYNYRSKKRIPIKQNKQLKRSPQKAIMQNSPFFKLRELSNR